MKFLSFIMKLFCTWKREGACPACNRVTTQVKHGFTADGKLWKGHLCLCKGWHCTQCDALFDTKGECCR